MLKKTTVDLAKFEFWFGLTFGVAVAWAAYSIFDPWTPEDPDSHQNFWQTFIGWGLLFACFLAGWYRKQWMQRPPNYRSVEKLPESNTIDSKPEIAG